VLNTSDNKSVYSLAVAWVLIVPLLYFAARGQFWFVGNRDFDANSINGTKLGAESAASSGLDYIVTALIIFTFIAVLVFSRVPYLITNLRKDALFFALAAVAIASTAWSQFPAASLKLSLCLAVNTVFAFYLHDRFEPTRLLKMLYMFGWIALTLSIVLALLFPRLGQISDMDLRVNVWRGIYSYKNTCAIPTIFLLSPVLYLSPSGFVARMCRLAYVFLSILVVLMTQSRTGWILLGCLFFYVLGTKAIHRSANKTALTALGITVTLPVAGAFLLYFEPIMRLMGKDASLSGRTDIWKAVIVSAMKRPILGYGYMGFFHGLQGENANVALQAGWNVSASHNGFLDIWVTLGAVGLVIVLWSFFRAFKNSFTCLLARGSSFSAWCGCVVFLMLVVNLDEKAMMVPNDLVWMLYIIACLGLAEAAKYIRLGQTHG